MKNTVSFSFNRQWMKRPNNLIEPIAAPDNIRLAAWKAAKGKRYTAEVLRWSEKSEKNVLQLRGQILSGRVQVGNYRYFTVYEPKERKICAAAFNEQVLHHSMMNICHDYFERRQIFDSYASRKGKGVYAALERARHYSNTNKWYLKLDIRKFFETISHEVLILQLSRLIKDPAVVGIFEQIIHSYETESGRGVPIGSLTSQYFANHYLNGLDRIIKEKIRARAYVRYMDDMVIWHDDKAALLDMRDTIREYVEQDLRCQLKPEGLNRTVSGLPFLGYHLFPWHIRLLQQSKQRFIRKMRKVTEAEKSEIWSQEKCQRHALPLLAFVRHADTGVLRKNVALRQGW